MKDSLLRKCGVIYMDHLAVTSPIFDQTLEEYLSLDGARLLRGPAINATQKVRYAFVQLREGLTVEILASEKDSPIAHHLRQGGGPYHFCYAVAELESSIATAIEMGAKVILPPTADAAFDGRKIAFLFHGAHGIFEFVEGFPSRQNPIPADNAYERGMKPGETAETSYGYGDSSSQGEHEERLKRLFKRIFPTLEEDDLPSAEIGNVLDWDSLAQIQLVMEIEAEFSINIPPEKIEKLTHYKFILNYLKQEAP